MKLHSHYAASYTECLLNTIVISRTLVAWGTLTPTLQHQAGYRYYITDAIQDEFQSCKYWLVLTSNNRCYLSARSANTVLNCGFYLTEFCECKRRPNLTPASGFYISELNDCKRRSNPATYFILYKPEIRECKLRPNSSLITQSETH